MLMECLIHALIDLLLSGKVDSRGFFFSLHFCFSGFLAYSIRCYSSDYIYLLLCVDRRQSSTNATTEIVAVTLGGDDIQGEK